jgi:hypothetical protein
MGRKRRKGTGAVESRTLRSSARNAILYMKEILKYERNLRSITQFKKLLHTERYGRIEVYWVKAERVRKKE